MCKGVQGLPRELSELGYKDKYIEYGFTNSEREMVVPELIISSEKLGHTILFEWKSGGNIEEDQLKRYSKVEGQDLRDKALLTKRESNSHDIAITGKEEYGERLRMGIEKGRYRFPILLVSPSRMYLALNSFVVSELNTRMREGIPIRLDECPQYFVPFDKESELWEVAEAIFPKVLELMGKNSRYIFWNDIAKETFRCWDIISESYKRELKTKIQRIMKQAADNEFREYFEYRRPDGQLKEVAWEVLINPAYIVPDRRYAAWRKMYSAQAGFLESLKSGQRQGVLSFPTDD